MILDIIVIVIMVLCMVFGFRRGFVHTFVHTLGWFGAMVAAFFFTSQLKDLLTEKTTLYDQIFTMFSDKLSLSTDSVTSSAATLPLILNRSINSATAEASNLLSTKLADLTMTILCFVIIFIVVKALLFFITLAFSRKQNKGFVGFFDGLLGLVAGMIRGIIFVFIFLALLLPITNLVSPASTQLILNSLSASYFSRTLYDSNFIVLIINDFLA